MTAIAPHVLYAVDIAGTLIDQVGSFGLAPGLQEIIAGGDGLVDPTYVAAMAGKPMVTFATTDIKGGLDAAGLDGRNTSSDVYLYFQAMVEGGTRAGATSHVKMTVVKGLLVPLSIGVTQEGLAVLMMGIVCWSADGTASPITIAVSQSLTGTPTTSVLWTMGTCKCNNADIPAQGAQVEFGINVQVEAADGLVYPTWGGIQNRAPGITFVTPNVVNLNTYGIIGAARASSTILTLRKLAEGATRVAPATEEHISFAVNQGRISVEDISGEHGDKLACAMRITPTSDGTNAIIVTDTTAAIA